MWATLHENDNHKRNMRRDKQVAPLQLEISVADKWLLSRILPFLTGSEGKERRREKKRWSSAQNWIQLFIDYTQSTSKASSSIHCGGSR